MGLDTNLLPQLYPQKDTKSCHSFYMEMIIPKQMETGLLK